MGGLGSCSLEMEAVVNVIYLPTVCYALPDIGEEIVRLGAVIALHKGREVCKIAFLPELFHVVGLSDDYIRGVAGEYLDIHIRQRLSAVRVVLVEKLCLVKDILSAFSDKSIDRVIVVVVEGCGGKELYVYLVLRAVLDISVGDNNCVRGALFALSAGDCSCKECHSCE